MMTPIRLDIRRGGQYDMPYEIESHVGKYCHYTAYEWLRGQYVMSLVVNVVVVLVCILLSAYIVYHKHDPVVVPMAAGERVGMLKEIAGLKGENAYLIEQVARHKERTVNLAAQVKRLNAEIASDVAKVEALQAHGAEIDRQNKELAVQMVTPQQVIVEAKRVLGVRTIVMREP